MSQLIKCFFPASLDMIQSDAPVLLSSSVLTSFILHYSITICQLMHPSHSINSYYSIYLSFCSTLFSHLSLFLPSALLSFTPCRELADWSWRRRWRHEQVVTTMTSGVADTAPAVAARRRWAIWDTAPLMAVSVCVCTCVYLHLEYASKLINFIYHALSHDSRLGS